MIPKQRIRWLHLEYAAIKDKNTLSDWDDGVITTTMAIKQICASNYLASLSEETFLENAYFLGYTKRIKKEGLLNASK